MFDFCTDMKICTQNHFNINQKQRPVLKKLQPVPASNRMKSEGDVFCTGVKGVSFLVEKEINDETNAKIIYLPYTNTTSTTIIKQNIIKEYLKNEKKNNLDR